jgi:MinD superfamily P-loop ATPase
MKEIVVISGKGGTGKTSFSAAFAQLEQADAVVADCDVDAANMHLLLKPDFAHHEDFYSGEIARIEEAACTQCGKCREVCRFDAIHFTDSVHRVDPISCEGCWYCSRVCPVDAIAMETQKTGEFYRSTARTGVQMVHAKLGFAAENSGKLVAKVKKEAKSLAQQSGRAWLIVDGSPGVGCPVISSLSGADLVVLVTEATVSGLHDLKRVYGLVKTFNLDAVCLINKYDLNTEVTEAIETFLAQEQIALVGKIPYDVRFARALSEAKTIVESGPEALRAQVKTIWETIKHAARS